MTRRLIIDSGDTTLDVTVEDDTDTDGEFIATDNDTGERIKVRGWMIDNMEEV